MPQLKSLCRSFRKARKEFGTERMFADVSNSFPGLMCRQLHHQCSSIWHLTVQNSNTPYPMKTANNPITEDTIELLQISYRLYQLDTRKFILIFYINDSVEF